MHGHSYRLGVAISGPLKGTGPSRGMVEDFDVIKHIVREKVIEALDHRSLNDLIENPTCEEIALWIWERLDPALAGLDEIVLWETQSSCAIVRRSDFA